MKIGIALVVAASNLVACKKEAGPIAVVGAPFDVANKQTITVKVGTDSLVQINLAEVVDSRCPANAYCFWAGNAEVTVTITDAISPVQNVHLSLTPRLVPDSVAVTLNQQPYWLRLLAVNPYPGTSSQTSTATLRLRPR